MATIKIKSNCILDKETKQQVRELIKQIASSACDLRNQLEELQDIMWTEEVELTKLDEVYNLNEYDNYDIQDLADQVSEIESLFEED